MQSKGLSRVFISISSKPSILQRSAFFTVQFSHPYMTTGKTIALTSWTFVGKVMSLLFNMLSRLVITFLPRSKHLLIHGCSHQCVLYFWGSNITADGDCSHDIKICLLLRIKVMTKLDSIFKSRDITLSKKGPSSQGYGFSSGHVWM